MSRHVPGAHAAQADAPDNEYEPAGHWEHATASLTLLNSPAGQRTHTPPAVEKKPRPHAVQLDEPTALERPAGQAVQLVEPPDRVSKAAVQHW